MLRYLRTGGKHTKAIWWGLTIVTVVTFLGGFVFLFGMGAGSGEMARRSGLVGTVDGSPITAQDYQVELSNQREAFRRQFGSEPVDRDEKAVASQTWRSLVTERLLTRLARTSGIQAYDHEVVLALESSPPSELVSQPAFQTSGKFDPDKYRAALRDPNSTFWEPFEELVRKQLPVRKLEERLVASIKLSEPELRELYHERYDRLDATVVAVLPDLKAKLPPPTPADLDRAYKEYQGRFNSGPRVDLEVLKVPKKFTDEDLRTARQFAVSLLERARKGEDFAQLARDYSEGPGASQGGLIGRLVQPSELGPDMGPRLEALQNGQVADPFQAGSRFILMKLLERVPEPGQAVPSLRLAQIVVRIRPSEGTLRDQFDQLNRLRSRAMALKSLGKAAAEKGMATSRTGFFDMNATPTALYDEPEAADWGFAARQPNEISPVFEGSDDFLIAQVAQRYLGGPVPRDQVGDMLRQIAEIDRRVELAKPAADRVAQALGQGRTLEEAARAAGVAPFAVQGLTRAQPDQRLAIAPDLVGQLFVASPGRTVGPLREPSGWYFGRTDRRTEAPMDSTFDRLKGQLMSDVLATRRRALFSDWVTALKTKAKIQDLRLQTSR
jgi:peptidyl-prolyl cis-trans isomerase D